MMKPVFKIAKNELRNLFYSPVAWFTLIIFLVMTAYIYTASVYPLVKTMGLIRLSDPTAQAALRKYWPWQATFTDRVFLGGFGNISGVFGMILQYLYLYVPLLTMSIINREFSGGTVKLLYSSPIRLRQIVWGKYLAIMVFNLFFTVIIGIFVIQAAIDLKALEYRQLLSGILGVYLLLCALTAIGFFMSSLTVYPVVAAIASFTALFILKAVGGLWQQHDFVRDITYFLSISHRTEWMLKGLIRSKDVVYYGIIIYMFVGFTLLKLRAGREIKPWYVKTARYLGIIVSGVAIGYVSNSPYLTAYLDTTVRKSYTIRPETQRIFRRLDHSLEVTLFVNLFDDPQNPLRLFPAGRNAFLAAWEPYVRFNPGIRFRYEYYYNVPTGDSGLYKQFPGKNLAQIAGLMSRGLRQDSALFQSPEEMAKKTDLKPEGYRSVMQLRYHGRTAFLRVIPRVGVDIPQGSSEPQFAAAFSRVLGDPIPKLAFVSGELERSIDKKGEREYSRQTQMVDFGIDFDTVNLTTENIAPDVTAVVLADPKMDISSGVRTKLKNYLESGGNMLIFGEPRKQYVLNPVLQQLGVQLMPGQLVQPSENAAPDIVNTYQTPVYFDLQDDSWFRYVKNAWTNEKVYDHARTAETALHGVTPIAVTGDSGFTVSPLFLTRPWTKVVPPQMVWLKAGNVVVDSTAPVFSPQDGDILQTSFATAFQLTRQIKGKEQRIIVCGDADFVSNIQGAVNSTPLYSWLNGGRFPVYPHIPHVDNIDVSIGPRWASMEKIIYVWVAPGILLVLGTVYLTRRKRM
ncbi:MAG: Gldg family protein [Chitinophagaceae bacterium]|nr:Gldg family protein [Chitinophagaceae bacterium]